MADSSLGAKGAVRTLLGSTAAAFAFGEAARFALRPPLAEDGALLAAAALGAERVGSTGVGVVAACLVFTSMLLSLGSGFLLAAAAMKLLDRLGQRRPWLADATTGTSVVMGAVTTGVLGGVIPAWLYIAAQAVMVLVVYSLSNINEMTTALLIIFTTLYVSVTYGRMGVQLGLPVMGLTIVLVYLARMAMRGRIQRPKYSCRLLDRIKLYCVFVSMLGFSVGAGVGETAEVVLILQSVLWVAFLSAGLLGAGLGTVAMVGLGPDVARNVAIVAAVTSSVAMRAIVPESSVVGGRGSVGGMLGVAAAAGVSLGAASVAAKEWFKSRNHTLALLASVVVGAVLALRGPWLRATAPATTELITITLVALGAFVLGAPKSPFHTQVNLRRGLLTGPVLISGIGMETVTAAAAPVGAGALGAAALGTAALGRLGTVGVVLAILVAVGKTLSGTTGQSPPTNK
ncbi:uncharacterized protein LOC143008464 [Genypterus blacodes]|uniref:uncharacterized protein LOC143008464 n=1 Tax=Genypterus blacodes TaxID=154954 RepID=UPI003F75C291